MARYAEMLETYRRRQKDTLVDTLAASLTYADEVAVDLGLLEEAGLAADLLGGTALALPFVVIAVTEQCKVILGKKTGASGLRDASFRMAKTGAALGVGAAVVSAAGVLPAIPATMGVRALFDRYRSRLLTGRRVQMRTQRLRELRQLMTVEVYEEAPGSESASPALCEGTDSAPQTA